MFTILSAAVFFSLHIHVYLNPFHKRHSFIDFIRPNSLACITETAILPIPPIQTNRWNNIFVISLVFACRNRCRMQAGSHNISYTRPISLYAIFHLAIWLVQHAADIYCDRVWKYTAVMMQMHQSIKLLCGLVPCASLKSKEETRRKHECSKTQNGDTRQYMRRMQSFELGFWITDVLVHSTHASSEQIHNHNMYVIMNEATRRGTPFHECHNLYAERTPTLSRTRRAICTRTQATIGEISFVFWKLWLAYDSGGAGYSLLEVLLLFMYRTRTINSRSSYSHTNRTTYRIHNFFILSLSLRKRMKWGYPRCRAHTSHTPVTIYMHPICLALYSKRRGDVDDDDGIFAAPIPLAITNGTFSAHIPSSLDFILRLLLWVWRFYYTFLFIRRLHTLRRVPCVCESECEFEKFECSVCGEDVRVREVVIHMKTMHAHAHTEAQKDTNETSLSQSTGHNGQTAIAFGLSLFYYRLDVLVNQFS